MESLGGCPKEIHSKPKPVPFDMLFRVRAPRDQVDRNRRERGAKLTEPTRGIRLKTTGQLIVWFDVCG